MVAVANNSLPEAHVGGDIYDNIIPPRKVLEVYKEPNPPQVLRDARHKDHCMELRGQIMQCKSCSQTISTTEMIIAALHHWNVFPKVTTNYPGNHATSCSIQKEWLDIAAYRYPYDFGVEGPDLGIESESDSHNTHHFNYWINNKAVRSVLMHF